MLVLLAAASALAAAPATSTSSAPSGKSDCAAPAPKALLRQSAYPGRRFELGPENTATETVSSGTVTLEIQTAGCYDGVEHSYLFEESAPTAPFDDRDHWISFASGRLKELKTNNAGREDVADLLEFLSRAPAAVTRGNGSELRLEVCRGGVEPTEDGCPRDSGGGHRFAVRALERGRVQVFVSRYRAL